MDIMGCNVPTFRSNLLLPSSGYPNTLMIKAGGGVQTNSLRPSSGFEEGSVETPVCVCACVCACSGATGPTLCRREVPCSLPYRSRANHTHRIRCGHPASHRLPFLIGDDTRTAVTNPQMSRVVCRHHTVGFSVETLLVAYTVMCLLSQSTTLITHWSPQLRLDIFLSGRN